MTKPQYKILPIDDDSEDRAIIRQHLWEHPKNILENTTDAFFVLDHQWCFTSFNQHAERLFKKTKEEVLGKRLWDQFPELTDSVFTRHYYRALTEQTTVEFAEQSPDSQTWFEVHVFPVQDGLSVYIRDITEQKQLKARLREHERLAIIGTTAVNLTHEIGNSLNGLSTTIQLLERYLPKQYLSGGSPLAEIVSDLKAETSRMQSILQDLRTLTNLHQLDLRPTNVTAVAAEILQSQAYDYAERGIRIEQVFPTDLPPVMADWEKLSQALLYLCNNAAEAMPSGGTLLINGTAIEEQVRLEVKDTGTGISEELEDIFEPFTTTKPGGTGLGLAVVKQLVAAHNGTITYTSTPGQGTTFTLLFPAASPETQKNNPSHIASRATKQPHR